MGSIKIQRSVGEWLELVNEYKASKLGKTDFCRSKGISRGYFYVWLSVLKEEGTFPKVDSKFIPVRVMPSKANDYIDKIIDNNIFIINSSFSIQGKSGLRIEFAKGCALSELKALTEVLHVV